MQQRTGETNMYINFEGVIVFAIYDPSEIQSLLLHTFTAKVQSLTIEFKD